MLKMIPPIISPNLLYTLSAMGHGDEIVLADGNFPAESQGVPVVRLDGHGMPGLLDAILALFPLDAYVPQPVAMMQVVQGDNFIPIIWEEYKTILKKHECGPDKIEYVERFQFYERAKKSFAIVATGEMSKYANIILKKGVITPEDLS